MRARSGPELSCRSSQSPADEQQHIRAIAISGAQALEPLIGRWKTRAQTRHTILGPGVPVTSVEEFYWLDGGHFLVQTYCTVFGDEPAQKGINYWFYDADAKKFRIIFFSNNGPFTEDGNRYEGEIARRTLTFVKPRQSRSSEQNGRSALSARVGLRTSARF